MKMIPISILPGEHIYSYDGSVERDDKGINQIAIAHTIVHVNNEVALKVYETLMASRMKYSHIMFNHHIQYKWVIQPDDDDATKQYGVLVNADKYVQVCNDYTIDKSKVHVLYENICWSNLPMKDKVTYKTIKKSVQVPILEEQDEQELQVIHEVFLNKKIAKYVKTGRTALLPKKEMLDVYDANGTFLGRELVALTETKTVAEEVLDESGNKVTETEIDNHGKIVKVPIYDVRYLDNDLNIVTQEKYSKKALLLPCLKYSDEVINLLH